MDRYFRKIFISACIFYTTFTSVIVFAHSDQELFLQAQQQYEQKNYKDAIEKYEQIHHKGPGVFLNLGVCYAALHDIPHAWVFFKKAEKSLEWKMYQRARAYIQLLGIENSYTDSWYSHLYIIYVSWSIWVGLLILQIIWLVCLLFIVFVTIRTSRIASFFLLLVSLLWFASGYGIYCIYTVKNFSYGLVVTKSSVYTGPGEQFGIHNELVPLKECIILKSAQQWIKVKHAKIVGWVPRNNVQLED